MVFDTDLDSLEKTAADLWLSYRNKRWWLFRGPMGSGKTTLIAALCRHLGVTGPVSSPTFALVSEYSSKEVGVIYHMDWYRIRNEEEAFQAGIRDCLDSGALCLVEWPEQAPGILQGDENETVGIDFETTGENTRRLSISLSGIE